MRMFCSRHPKLICGKEAEVPYAGNPLSPCKLLNAFTGVMLPSLRALSINIESETMCPWQKPRPRSFDCLFDSYICCREEVIDPFAPHQANCRSIPTLPPESKLQPVDMVIHLKGSHNRMVAKGWMTLVTHKMHLASTFQLEHNCNPPPGPSNFIVQ